MSNDWLSRNPVATHRFSFAATNVTTGAWVEVVTLTDQPCSSLEIFNSGGRILQFSNGSAGNEAANLIDYTILPGGSSILLPINLAKNSRLSCKAVDSTSNVGYLIFNLFA